jgi:hypothetical protein
MLARTARSIKDNGSSPHDECIMRSFHFISKDRTSGAIRASVCKKRKGGGRENSPSLLVMLRRRRDVIRYDMKFGSSRMKRVGGGGGGSPRTLCVVVVLSENREWRQMN